MAFFETFGLAGQWAASANKITPLLSQATDDAWPTDSCLMSLGARLRSHMAYQFAEKRQE